MKRKTEKGRGEKETEGEWVKKRKERDGEGGRCDIRCEDPKVEVSS